MNKFPGYYNCFVLGQRPRNSLLVFRAELTHSRAVVITAVAQYTTVQSIVASIRRSILSVWVKQRPSYREVRLFYQLVYVSKLVAAPMAVEVLGPDFALRHFCCTRHRAFELLSGLLVIQVHYVKFPLL